MEKEETPIYYMTHSLDTTTYLVLVFFLLVILWCLIKLEQRKDAKMREKIRDDIDKQVKGMMDQ